MLGDIIQGGIKEQTTQSLSNMKAVLEEAGSSLEKVVKTTVFLKDMNDFAAMNEVYSKVISSPFFCFFCVCANSI